MLRRIISDSRVKLLAAFAAMSFIDAMLQFGEGSNADAVFQRIGPFTARAAWLALKHALLIVAPALIFPRLAKVYFPVVWAWVAFMCAVQTISRTKFGISLDGDWVMIVLCSSAEEMARFWPDLLSFPWTYAAVAIFGVVGYFGCRAFRSVTVKRNILLGILFLLPFAYFNCMRQHLARGLSEMMYLYFPVDTAGHYHRFSDMIRTARAPRLPSDLRPVTGPMAGIVVVGESATRSNWSLYGYDRKTTPRMDALKDELVVAPGMTANMASTGQALRLMLTRATTEAPRETYCTLAQCYRAMGCRTALVSNQSRWGRWGGVEGLIFSGCEKNVYLRSETKERPLYDSAMLKHVASILDNAAAERRPTVVFLHLQGSHEPFFSNYPPQWNRWGSGTMLDAYDNSILFTDHLLGELVSMLKGLDMPTFLFYTSDHGESPRSKHWRDGNSPDLHAVPCILWRSKANPADAALKDVRFLDKLFPFLVELPSR